MNYTQEQADQIIKAIEQEVKVRSDKEDPGDRGAYYARLSGAALGTLRTVLLDPENAKFILDKYLTNETS